MSLFQEIKRRLISFSISLTYHWSIEQAIETTTSINNTNNDKSSTASAGKGLLWRDFKSVGLHFIRIVWKNMHRSKTIVQRPSRRQHSMQRIQMVNSLRRRYERSTKCMKSTKSTGTRIFPVDYARQERLYKTHFEERLMTLPPCKILSIWIPYRCIRIRIYSREGIQCVQIVFEACKRQDARAKVVPYHLCSAPTILRVFSFCSI